MKKMNKFIALFLSIVMTMSFALVSNADTGVESEKVLASIGTDIPIGANGGLDLEPETLGVGTTISSDSFTETFTYTSQVDCSLNFQIDRNASGDKHKNNGTYSVSVKKDSQDLGIVTEGSLDSLKAYPITAKSKYYFTVTRTYSPKVTDAYISITAKINPDVINESYSNSYSGDKDASKYYSFTPVQDGGYLFKMTPSNGCIGTDKNYLLTIYSKVGSSVNEFASYEKGVSESNLRLYLKSNVEYIIKAQAFGDTGLGYSFSVETVPLGPGVSLVGAPGLVLDTETSCILCPFANRRAFSWYSFTAPKDGCYEFVINNKFDAKNKGDIVVELRDEIFSPVEDEDKLYLYENESDVISTNMKQGEVCYIQVAEMYKGNLSDVYTVGIKVREHAHSKKIVIDGNYVIYGCPCQDEEAMEYAFWLNKVKIKNVTYNGKTASPVASFDIMDSVCKEGVTIPGIPKNAYTITVTSKNKKDVGAAKAKVKFTGDYKGLGSYNVSFKIVPRGTTLSSVNAGNKAFTAKWKKQTSKTSGYQIRYSLYEGMYSAKTVTINSNKTTSKKISKLQENTAYYVQVRTYKTVGGKKYYSSWSGKTGVTTK